MPRQRSPEAPRAVLIQDIVRRWKWRQSSAAAQLGPDHAGYRYLVRRVDQVFRRNESVTVEASLIAYSAELHDVRDEVSLAPALGPRTSAGGEGSREPPPRTRARTAPTAASARTTCSSAA